MSSSGGTTPAITHNAPTTSPAKSTSAVYPITIDSYGHITAAGSAVTIPTVNNGTLTIQRNGTTVGTFTANQSGNTTANITVPTTAVDIATQLETTSSQCTNVDEALNALNDEKQDALESGVSIKTINNESVLGSGNITVGGIPSLTIKGSVASPTVNAGSITDHQFNYALSADGTWGMIWGTAVVKGAGASSTRVVCSTGITVSPAPSSETIIDGVVSGYTYTSSSQRPYLLITTSGEVKISWRCSTNNNPIQFNTGLVRFADFCGLTASGGSND